MSRLTARLQRMYGIGRHPPAGLAQPQLLLQVLRDQRRHGRELAMKPRSACMTERSIARSNTDEGHIRRRTDQAHGRRRFDVHDHAVHFSELVCRLAEGHLLHALQDNVQRAAVDLARRDGFLKGPQDMHAVHLYSEMSCSAALRV